jgi:hypothetical protein
MQVYGGMSVAKDLWVVGNIYGNVGGNVSANIITIEDPLAYFSSTSTYPYNYDIGFYSHFSVTGPQPGNGYQHTGLVRDFNDNTWKLFSNVAEPVLGVVTFDGNTVYDAFKSGAITSTSTISAVGNITGGNILGGANVNATTHTGTTVSVSGTVTAASVVGGVMTGTSVSVSGTVIASGNITGGNITTAGVLTVNSGGAATAIVNGAGNASGNIGSSTGWFNTLYATSSKALYADLAENYQADAEYAPGTVLVFGGTAEVTVDAVDGDRRVAGVVSTNPSYVMNAGLEGTNVASVALTGRVPCFVIGQVKKGDLMVAAGLGRARAEADPKVGTVIGKALEDFNGSEGTIEVVVGRF